MNTDATVELPALPELLTAAMIRTSIVPVDKRTMQRWIAAEKFPRPDLRVGPRTFWKRETITTWIESQGCPTGGRRG